MDKNNNSFMLGRWVLHSPAIAGFHIALLLILIGACVTWIWGVNGSVTLKLGEQVREYVTEKGEKAEFPFALILEDCRVEYHDATTAPKDFISELSVAGCEDAGKKRVSMNKALDIEGYRFCQKAMNIDESTLTVNHDPWGVAVTYSGYFLLFLASAVIIWRWLWKGLRRGRRAITAVLLAVTCSSAFGGRVADDFARLRVYWGDRPAPVGSMAADILNRVYGKSRYQGKEATEVMMGWLFDYDRWKREPMIKVKGEKVKKALGVKGKYARLTDFFGSQGYKLQPLLDDISDKEVQEVHERVMLLTSLCTGQILRIYPYKSALGRQEWLSYADTKPSKMDIDQWVFITRSANDLARALAFDDRTGAREAIAGIARYQKEQLSSLSDKKLNLELFYNRCNRELPTSCLCLLTGLVGWLLAGKLKCLSRIAVGVVATAILLYLSAMIALRWIVSGHLPLSNGYETMQAMGWIAAFGAAIVSWRRPRIGAMLLLVGGLALMVNVMNAGGASLSPLLPVLASPLLSVHVLLVMTAYTLLALVMLNSISALSSRDSAKRASATVISMKLLQPAVIFLACGIFVGAIWANQSWGRYWGWDPKETWALITFIIYSIPFHSRWLRFLRNSLWLNLYLSVAFLSVLMTYFGVNFLLGGMHSYA